MKKGVQYRSSNKLTALRVGVGVLQLFTRIEFHFYGRWEARNNNCYCVIIMLYCSRQ